MSIEANKALVARYLAAWGTGDTAVFAEILVPDFVDHAHPDWQPGSASLGENLRQFRQAFSDVQFTVDQVLCEGDLVAFRATIRAKHTGWYGPFAPTGKPVTYHAMDIMRIEHDRIAEIWALADTLDWVRQLGATVTLPDAAPPSSDAEN
jgi:predicted ester cyclase